MRIEVECPYCEKVHLYNVEGLLDIGPKKKPIKEIKKKRKPKKK